MAKNPAWTNEQRDIIRRHYAAHGARYCAELLGKTTAAVHHKAEQMNVRRPHRKFNSFMFATVTSPIVSYLMGYLWADGHVSNRDKIVVLMAVKTDVDELRPLFEATGEWSYGTSVRNLRGNERPRARLKCSASDIAKIFLSLDYHLKSSISPTKPLNHIPPHLHSHFWRGYFDGDGCLFVHDTHYRRGQLAFSSSYEQDWKQLSSLCASLGVRWRTSTYISRIGHRSSTFTISGNEGIGVFMRYLYGEQWDGIGLRRKHAKWILFCSKPLFQRPVKLAA